MYDAAAYAYGSTEETVGTQAYYRARYYDSQTGRFISEDPSRFFGGIAFYSYADNNVPLTSDSSGLAPKPGDYTYDFQAHFYAQYGATLNDCLQKKFGKNLPCQTIENAPDISTQYNGFQIFSLLRKGKGYADGAASLSFARTGKILIASDEFLQYSLHIPTSTGVDLNFVYAHELANYLDLLLHGSATTYGNSRDRDPDTGRQIEQCLRKSLGLPPAE